MNKNNKFLSEQEEELLLAVQESKNDLLSFCQLLDKNFEVVWFHELIANKLEQALKNVQEKKKARIIITIPPRHGKSTIASQYFPAWVLGKKPDIQIILSTYGAELAETMGMKTRDIIDSEKYQAIFPGIHLRPDVKAKAKWMTNEKGSYTAVGIGGAVTGIGGSIILLDDPHKDRAEAESATMRENVWQYYKDTLYSRLEGFGAVIVIMQRWHTDDLVGKILELDEQKRQAGEPTEDWEVINFPAIAEEDEFVEGQLVRKVGEALWPSKFPLEVLYNIRTQSLYKWSGQYMQNPIHAESQEFKEEMFKFFEQDDINDKYLSFITTVDPASYKKKSDQNVILTVGKEVNGQNWYVVEVTAGVMDPGKVIDAIFMHQAKYNSEVAIEGVAYQSTLKWHVEERQRKDQRFFIVNEYSWKGNKADRIRSLIALLNLGILYFRRSQFKLMEQLLQFPRGKHDDQCDALAMVLQVIQKNKKGFHQYRPKWIGYGKKEVVHK